MTIWAFFFKISGALDLKTSNFFKLADNHTFMRSKPAFNSTQTQHFLIFWDLKLLWRFLFFFEAAKCVRFEDLSSWILSFFDSWWFFRNRDIFTQFCYFLIRENITFCCRYYYPINLGHSWTKKKISIDKRVFLK